MGIKCPVIGGVLNPCPDKEVPLHIIPSLFLLVPFVSMVTGFGILGDVISFV